MSERQVYIQKGIVTMACSDERRRLESVKNSRQLRQANFESNLSVCFAYLCWQTTGRS